MGNHLIDTDFEIDADHPFIKKRTENLERVCELVYEDHKNMYDKVMIQFNRSISDYYLERNLFPKDKDIIQKAYIETLGYISKTKEK